MTVQQLAARIGSECNLTIDKLTIRVVVLDVRQAFGRIDYLVRPVAGDGLRWVDSRKIRLEVNDVEIA